MSASFEKTGLVVADWGCYDDWVGVEHLFVLVDDAKNIPSDITCQA